MNIDLHVFCARLGLATLNGLYQGIILSAMVAVFLKLVLRTNAATRHAVWLACLGLVALLIPAHFWLDRAAPDGPAPGTGALLPRSQPVASAPAGPDFPGADAQRPSFDLKNPGEEPGTRGAPAVTESAAQSLPARLGSTPPPVLPNPNDEGPRAIDGVSDAPARLAGGAWSAGWQLLPPLSWSVQPAAAFPVLSSLILLWFVVGVIRLVILFVRLRQIRLFSVGAFPPNAELLTRFGRLREDGRVRRGVELRISSQLRCPVVLGFRHPVVLLPADMAAQADTAEVDHVLRHELAHVRRHDDWANLAQHFVQALLFFHPAVWWINRQLSLEREIACDDHVLAQGGGRRHYALILTTVASRLRQKTPLLAPGVSNSTNQLKQRIHMILNTRRNASPGLAKGWSTSIISATALLAALALYSCPRLVLAAEPTALALTSPVAVSVSPSPLVAPETLVEPAEPPVAVVAIGVPDRLSADVGPGPKFKTDGPRAEASGDDQIESPEPPEAPGVDTLPAPPAIPRAARAGKPGKRPRRPEASDIFNKDDGSIEDRLRRLEKMTAELMEQQGLKRSNREFIIKDPTGPRFDLDREQMEKLNQEAERKVARAAEQAERAAVQANRATKELEARLDQDRPAKGEFHESLQGELESLRKAREGLGREMERLSRQIQKLEMEQQRNNNKNGDKAPERRSEAAPDKLRAQASIATETELPK